jgi:hypothetical protein
MVIIERVSSESKGRVGAKPWPLIWFFFGSFFFPKKKEQPLLLSLQGIARCK